MHHPPPPDPSRHRPAVRIQISLWRYRAGEGGLAGDTSHAATALFFLHWSGFAGNEVNSTWLDIDEMGGVRFLDDGEGVG